MDDTCIREARRFLKGIGGVGLWNSVAAHFHNTHGRLNTYRSSNIQRVIKKHETWGLVLDILERIKGPLGKRKM